MKTSNKVENCIKYAADDKCAECKFEFFLKENNTCVSACEGTITPQHIEKLEGTNLYFLDSLHYCKATELIIGC